MISTLLSITWAITPGRTEQAEQCDMPSSKDGMDWKCMPIGDQPMSLYYDRSSAEQDNIRFAIKCKMGGWCAMGFGPKKEMIGTAVVVQDNEWVAAELLGKGIAPKPKNDLGIEGQSTTVENGITETVFTIPRTRLNDFNVLWAWKATGDKQQMHDKKGEFDSSETLKKPTTASLPPTEQTIPPSSSKVGSDGDEASGDSEEKFFSKMFRFVEPYVSMIKDFIFNGINGFSTDEPKPSADGIENIST